jgi:uncharacterized glyoxalase superfamily protein PhnB
VLDIVVDDADRAFERAVDAGASPVFPVSRAFWGDRYAWVTDPFGFHWSLTQVEEVLAAAEVQRRIGSHR